MRQIAFARFATSIAAILLALLPVFVFAEEPPPIPLGPLSGLGAGEMDVFEVQALKSPESQLGDDPDQDLAALEAAMTDSNAPAFISTLPILGTIFHTIKSILESVLNLRVYLPTQLFERAVNATALALFSDSLGQTSVALAGVLNALYRFGLPGNGSIAVATAASSGNPVDLFAVVFNTLAQISREAAIFIAVIALMINISIVMVSVMTTASATMSDALHELIRWSILVVISANIISFLLSLNDAITRGMESMWNGDKLDAVTLLNSVIPKVDDGVILYIIGFFLILGVLIIAFLSFIISPVVTSLFVALAPVGVASLALRGGSAFFRMWLGGYIRAILMYVVMATIFYITTKGTAGIDFIGNARLSQLIIIAVGVIAILAINGILLVQIGQGIIGMGIGAISMANESFGALSAAITNAPINAYNTIANSMSNITAGMGGANMASGYNAAPSYVPASPTVSTANAISAGISRLRASISSKPSASANASASAQGNANASDSAQGNANTSIPSGGGTARRLRG